MTFDAGVWGPHEDSNRWTWKSTQNYKHHGITQQSDLLYIYEADDSKLRKNKLRYYRQEMQHIIKPSFKTPVM